MSRRPAGCRVLPFQAADALAKLGAEVRLAELLQEVREIEGWIRETQSGQDACSATYGRDRAALAIVKR